MRSRRIPLAAAFLLIGALLLSVAFLRARASANLTRKDGVVVPSYVSKYDLCTWRDLRYLRLLDRFLGDPGTPEKWLLFRQMKKEMYPAIANALDAPVIAETVTTAVSIGEHEASKPIRDLVADCARILHIDPPRVWLKQSPSVDAYVATLEEPHFLVIPSGLLELYEGRPRELRFVVGHELGHLKCDHLGPRRVKEVAEAVKEALKKIDVVGLSAQITPTVGLAFLLSWCREADIGADRAGLLCCQDIDSAQQALVRRLHGLKFDSPWLDPQHKDFDPDRVVAEFEGWENEPLVKLRLFWKLRTASDPFIPDRIAAMRLWQRSGMLQGILARKEKPTEPSILTINEVSLSGLQENDETVNPYCYVYHEGVVLCKLSTATGNPSPMWPDVNQAVDDWQPGQPIFIEVWNSERAWSRPWRQDTLLAEAAIFPQDGQTEYLATMARDLIDRKTTLNSATAKVTVQFKAP
jgi:hypothetical protein